jgi:hypothetical protein
MAEFKIARIRFTWKGDWSAGTIYTKDDIVRYGGKSYVCLVGHTSDTNFYTDLYYIDTTTEPDTDAPKWTLWFDGYAWRDQWDYGTLYNVGDIVRYNGIVYLCNTTHVSAFNQLNIQIIDAVATGTLVTLTFAEQEQIPFVNGSTIVITGVSPSTYNGTFVVSNCTTTSVSFSSVNEDEYVSGGNIFFESDAGLEADQLKWTSYARIDNWREDWELATRYRVNDIVKYNGIVYRCVEGHTSDESLAAGLEVDDDKWEVLTLFEKWLADWTTDYRYRRNDIVKYGGIVYRCIEGHTSSETALTGLENDQLKWEIVCSGVEFKQYWTEDTRYKLNDIVKYGAAVWLCTAHHASGEVFDPTKWESLIPGFEYDSIWISTVLYRPGDVVKYGGYSYYSKTHNTNKAPSSNTSDWDLLTIGFRIRGEWDAEVQYYTGDTIRRFGYLYTAIADNIDENPTDNTLFWELVVSGMHWKNFWAPDVDYVVGDVVTHRATSYICVADHTSALGDTPLLDVSNTYWTTYIEGDTGNVLSNQGDIVTYDTDVNRYAIGSDSQVLLVDSSSVNWEEFGVINNVYYVALDGVDAVGRGTTLNYPWRTVKYACENITGPATIFIKTGIFEEQLPISIPADVALVGDELRSTTIVPAVGFEGDDMFYVRNGCGIRNMTLKGLTGTLGAITAYGTRRPSGGAFVSLDPGTGPTDDAVWITTRSPYVQNVTTFGTGCVGLKVDGGLHNGGNKSIVANDFTQVISDGIGAWVTNLGLSELVSVFSYYGHIGYLAENGGKIRATNGNSSYGTYGCVSEGVNTTEDPITGIVNNRASQAQVASVFAGQANDEILVLEYANAGSNYTTATYSITGAGVGVDAVVGTPRSRAVSEVRCLQPSTNVSAGGGSYLVAGNNCQAGDNLTITIAANDENTFTEYEGMRIIITSGTGVGQYGYIQAYDDVSKVITVYKESDDTPGWDHVVVGHSIESLLDTTTYYNIEPRIEFSDPGTVGGIRALGRVVVASGRIDSVKIWDPGANYPYAAVSATRSGSNLIEVSLTDGLIDNQPIEFINADTSGLLANTPYYIIAGSIVSGTSFKVSATQGSTTPVTLTEVTGGMFYQAAPLITITDPNNTSDAILRSRISDGVLPQPTFNNRGTGYQTSTTTCTITGDGYADIYQVGKFLKVSNLNRLPGPGANLTIDGITNVIYKIVTIEDLGSGSAQFRISPELKVINSPVHSTALTIREKYSQVRLTGHDFLDIGTGNFVDTNYPTVNDLLKAPENEVYERGGGRVFYTSTDQDGNFRCGELFKVEQATGTVTISADFFELSGLEELSLGGVAIGGSSVVIREFSTDSTFTADSNNVVPTQRAIKAYIARRISGGGADAQTGQLTAGIVRIGPQKIDTSTNQQVNMLEKVNVKGNIDGTMLMMSYFAQSFNTHEMD